MLDAKGNKITLPMRNFIITNKNVSNTKELIERLINDQIISSKRRSIYELDQPILLVSFGVDNINKGYMDIIDIYPVTPSIAASFTMHGSKGVDINILLQYYREIFIDKNQELFMSLVC